MPNTADEEESNTDDASHSAPYAPVVKVPKGLREAVMSQGGSLNGSLGPAYYPTQPHSEAGRGLALANLDPLQPLQPPWPRLPEVHGQAVPKTVRSFLDRQQQQQ